MKTAAWGAGYVTDTPYTNAFYRELSPAWLSTVASLRGQPPIDGSLGGTYVELGCGNGLTTVVVGAALPRWKVFGYDFNPAHIERARLQAAQLGVDNVQFEERSFGELLDDPQAPAQVDVITLHGIWSWVTESAREEILQYVARRLRPGGLVYVSYNCATGWSGLAPIRDLLRATVATDPRPSSVAVRDALSLAAQLERDEAPIFPLPRNESLLVGGVGGQDATYLAHELLNSTFHATSLSEVARAFATVKCDYLGSTASFDVRVELGRMRDDLVEEFEHLDDELLRLALMDLVGEQTFRRDVFRRGLVESHQRDHDRWFDSSVFAALSSHLHGDAIGQRLADVAGATPEMVNAFLGGAFPAPARLEQLRAVNELKGLAPSQMRLLVASLIDLDLLVPVLPNWEASDASRRVNRALAAEVRADRTFVVSPATTSTLTVRPQQLALLGEVWVGDRRTDAELADRASGRLEPGMERVPAGSVGEARTLALRLADLGVSGAVTTSNRRGRRS